MSTPLAKVHGLADRPDLVAGVGILRWREWGYGEADPQSWIEVTAAEAGRDRLPITLVAVDHDAEVVGAVALGHADRELSATERRGRSPWLLGLVVRPQDRRRGVGRVLVGKIGRLAADLGHRQVWVATGGEAVEFYRRCGWYEAQQLRLESTGIPTTILIRHLSAVD